MSTGVLAAFDADPAAAEQQQRGRATMAAIVEDAARAGTSFVDDAAWRSRARRAAASPTAAAPRRLDGGCTPVAPRRDGRCPHRGACATCRPRCRRGRRDWCSNAPATAARRRRPCRFAAGDDVVCSPGPTAPSRWPQCARRRRRWSSTSAAPLAQAWPAGTRVSVVEARTYALRADAATGLPDCPRHGTGPGDAARRLRAAVRESSGWWPARRRPCGSPRTATPEHTTYGPLPPRGHRRGCSPWPAGENCVFARDAAGASASGWRRSAPARSRCRSRASRRAVVPVCRRGARRAGTPTWRGSSACGCGSSWPWPRRCCGRRSGR